MGLYFVKFWLRTPKCTHCHTHSFQTEFCIYWVAQQTTYQHTYMCVRTQEMKYKCLIIAIEMAGELPHMWAT